MIKICKICNKEYDGHYNSSCCSKECRKQARKITCKKYRQKITDKQTKEFEEKHIGEWIDIKGYEGLYMINKKGEIKSTIRQGGGNILLKKSLHKDGYYTYKLRKKNKGIKGFLLHRLLALHFIDNPNNYPMVDHIDRNRTNNDLSNLRWITPAGNTQNSDRVDNRKGSISIDKRTVKGKTYMYYRFFYTIYHNDTYKRKSKRFKTKEEAIEFQKNFIKNNYNALH